MVIFIQTYFSVLPHSPTPLQEHKVNSFHTYSSTMGQSKGTPTHTKFPRFPICVPTSVFIHLRWNCNILSTMKTLAKYQRFLIENGQISISDSKQNNMKFQISNFTILPKFKLLVRKRKNHQPWISYYIALKAPHYS